MKSNQWGSMFSTVKMADISRLYIGIFLVFVGYSLYDIGLFSDSAKSKDVPAVEVTENSAPTLKFLFCYSCGYKKTFEDYVNIIEKKYPGMVVKGANYDPPGISMKLAKVLNIAKILFFMAVMFGINPYQLVGSLRPPPSWWIWCTQNKLYAGVMCFCLTNTIEGLLMSTGAFEISFDGVPVWSKLDTGRIPQPAELFEIIDSLTSFNKYDMNMNTHNNLT